MPNIAFALKAEISRIARKELRADTLVLKKASAKIRTELASLKRRLLVSEKLVGRSAPALRSAKEASPAEVPAGFRFSAKGLAMQRKRLGLSARECALLLGATAQSIYNWERGKVRPHARHLTGIAELRQLGVKGARTRLEALTAG